MTMMIQKRLLSLILFLVSYALAYIPPPTRLLVNDETKQCTRTPNFFSCFATCIVRKDWNSLGGGQFDDGDGCPLEYSWVDYYDDFAETGESAITPAYFCIADYMSMGEEWDMCCGCFGECGVQVDDFVVNEALGQCSQSKCNVLPLGWTESDMESCLNFDWVQPNELECEDPCAAEQTCGDCLSNECFWSHKTNSCSSYCYDSFYDGSCIARSSVLSGTDNEALQELCEETMLLYEDMKACSEMETFVECTNLNLSINPSKTCRWVSTCEGEDTFYGHCEKCVANDCSGWEQCIEIHSTEESRFCNSNSCEDCVQEGCYWAAGEGCYQEVCPDDKSCASISLPPTAAEAAPGSPPRQGPSCRDIENAFWDQEYCIEFKDSCVACSSARLPSNPSEYCKFYQYSGSDDTSRFHIRCGTHCPAYGDICNEIQFCEPSDPVQEEEFCHFYTSCAECTMNGCFWYDERCMNICPDGYDCIAYEDCPDPFRYPCRSIRTCSQCVSYFDCYWKKEDGSCDDAEVSSARNGDYRVNDSYLFYDDIPSNQSAIEYCLRHGFSSNRRFPSECTISWSVTHLSEDTGKPCTHCLSEGCSWVNGHCDVPCEDECDKNATANWGVTAKLLAESTADDEVALPLEFQISHYCEQDLCCTSYDSCDNCINNGCGWSASGACLGIEHCKIAERCIFYVDDIDSICQVNSSIHETVAPSSYDDEMDLSESEKVLHRRLEPMFFALLFILTLYFLFA